MSAFAAALVLSIGRPALAWGEAAPLPPQAIAKLAFPSTVMVVMSEAGTDRVSQGSGFFVGPGLIVTNFHVVAGAARGWARVIGDETRHAIEGVVAADRDRDLVVLRLRDADVPPLPRGDAEGLSIADKLYAVGNPKGLEGTFSEGILSSIRRLEGETMLQITTPISEGSSGGPVIDAHGRVVGVAVGMLKDGQNLNFAIPVGYVERLLADVQAPQPLSIAARTAPDGPAAAPAHAPGPADAAGRVPLDCGTFTCRLPVGWRLEANETATAAFRATRASGGNALLTVFFRDHADGDIDGFAGRAIASLGPTYLKHRVIDLGGERAYLIMYKADAASGPVFASDVRVIHADVEYTISLWSDADAPDMRAIGEDFELLARSWRWK